MRRTILSIAFAGAIFGPALAVENFIPGGHTYSPENIPLPRLNSERDDVNKQADIIQSDIYTKQREQKLIDSQFRRFMSEQELHGDDFTLDY
ncbi:hypothetical protein G5V57_26665 [Nordella sp. HKS 07]|uniref:hypothetical protein n=1 Tax=Nordella sp. HKS 07 TaxID=2712222 RepID=UPI0013E1AA37|nr:hypothetical protein [Nordella sp. HKS 07]QIG50997.1 hypothetical protein G5V57_26665 [Nordella sp. HKS 07]